MTELFRNLGRDVDALISSIQGKVNKLPLAMGEQKKQAVRSIQRDLDTAKDLVCQLQQLELELKNQSATERSSYEKQYRTRRQAVDGFVKQLSQLAYGYGTIDTGGVDFPIGADPNRQKLLVSQEQMSRTQDRLTNAERLATETEALGTSILGTLHEQRDVISRAGDRLNETEANLKRGDRTVRGMRVRAAVMRVIWWLVLFAVLAIIIVILYIQIM